VKLLVLIGNNCIRPLFVKALTCKTNPDLNLNLNPNPNFYRQGFLGLTYATLVHQKILTLYVVGLKTLRTE